MVSKASDDLPDPDSPVITTSLCRGMSTSMFLRLWTRAPRTFIQSWAIARGQGFRVSGFRWSVANSLQSLNKYRSTMVRNGSAPEHYNPRVLLAGRAEARALVYATGSDSSRTSDLA